MMDVERKHRDLEEHGGKPRLVEESELPAFLIKNEDEVSAYCGVRESFKLCIKL